jgi:hypothetical protein
MGTDGATHEGRLAHGATTVLRPRAVGCRTTSAAPIHLSPNSTVKKSQTDGLDCIESQPATLFCADEVTRWNVNTVHLDCNGVPLAQLWAAATFTMSVVPSPNVSLSMPVDLPFPSHQELLRFSKDRQDGTSSCADDVLTKAGKRASRFSTRHLREGRVSGSGVPGASLLDDNLDGGNNSILPTKAPKDPSPSHPPPLLCPASVVHERTFTLLQATRGRDPYNVIG